MRFALLFATKLLISAIVVAYVLAMLAASCLPVTDAAGQVQAVPRWEYWLLHASVPSAIWWQWTGGLQPIVMSDRLPILGLALLWTLGCYWMGRCVSKLDAIASRLSQYEQVGISILTGQSILSMLVFLVGSMLGIVFLPWIMFLVLIALIVLYRLGQLNELRSPSTNATSEPSHWMATDPSFASSVSRRMVGLLVLATSFLAVVQVYGATIPTHDTQVREVDWWMTKHAAHDGVLRWSDNHAMVNAPAGFNMPSVFFASLLTNSSSMRLGGPGAVETNPSSFSIEAKEHWNQSLRTCVLAGKTVNAILCFVGVFLAAVHLGKRWGVLAGLIVAMVLLSTPGIAELARLGRTEALVGIWGVALLVLYQTSRETEFDSPRTGLIWGCLIAGALGSGYAAAFVVGIPAIALTLVQLRKRLKDRLTPVLRAGSGTRVMMAVLALAAFAPYLRNTLASGDPISPWGSVLMQRIGSNKSTEKNDALLYAYRIPSETIDETIAAADFETTTRSSSEGKSPYRWANFVDGVFRWLGNSNVHGLILIPLAIVGCFVGRMESKRLAIGWAMSWMIVWWLFSTRQDRDWVGVLFLLAWPVASGVEWMLSLARGYVLFFLVAVSIAWSVVVIPTWPTSDNRMLMSLQGFDRNPASGQGSGDDKLESHVDSYANQFNEVLRQSKLADAKTKVLLIGESDDFEIFADCVSNGPFDACIFDNWTKLQGREIQALLRENEFTHLLIVWSGIRYRGRLTGRDRELETRWAIEKMLAESKLQSIPWKINSSEAELFLVKEE